MEIVARWTGRHGLALAESMRLPREVFARKLGISPRTVADWAKQPGMPLALKTQELLDVVLDQGSPTVRMRFTELLRPAYWPDDVGASNASARGDLVERAATYQRDSTNAVALLGDLAAADLNEHSDVHRAGWIQTSGPAAITGYLFGNTAMETLAGNDERSDTAERIRTASRHLMDLDFQLGGGVVRRMLLVYFQHEVGPLLRGRSHSEQERREIFRAAAEVTQLLGWSAYDAGAHGVAQGYYTQGLSLAREANDAQLAGYLMADLSHQANFLGNYGDALQLAGASQSAGNGAATATQATAALAMEARALASLGDRAGCLAIVAKMERLFERSAPHDDPQWMSYFTAEELAGEMLHCFTDLGMPAEARAQSALALAPDTPARTRVFIEMTTARAIALAGDLDEAIATARGALSNADAVASARCGNYVSTFNNLLRANFGKDARVTQFLSDVKRDYPNLGRAS